ncbi:MAG: ATP-binding protein [Bryobacteraceae bacterium]
MNPNGPASGTSMLTRTVWKPYRISLAVLLVALVVTALQWRQEIGKERARAELAQRHRLARVARAAEGWSTALGAVHLELAKLTDPPITQDVWNRYAEAINSRRISGLAAFGVFDKEGRAAYWYPEGAEAPPIPAGRAEVTRDGWLISIRQDGGAMRTVSVVQAKDLADLAAGGGDAESWEIRCGPPRTGQEPAALHVAIGPGGACALESAAPEMAVRHGISVLAGGMAATLLLVMLVHFLAWTRLAALSQAAESMASAKRREADARNLISIANRTTDGFLILDSGGRILWVNESIVNLTGYSHEQLAGSDSFALLLGPEASAAQLAEARESLITQRAIRFEAPIVDRAGSRHWLEVDLEPIHGDDGEIAHYLGITRPLFGGLEMHDAAFRMRRALDSVSEGISVWDGRGGYVYHNPAFEQRFGYSIDECRALGGPDALVAERAGPERPGGHRASEGAGRPRLYAGSTGETRELAMRCKDGRILEIQARVSQIVNDRNTSIGCVAIFTDISGAKHLERTLREARDEALAASAAKSAFLANISHELRTPLNGVTGMISLLQTTTLDEEQTEYARLAELSGAMLLRVINDILDFSKLEAERMRLEWVPFDLRALVEECASVASANARLKGLAFECIIAGLNGAPHRGDPTRLRQVINNLLSNALKFTERGCIRLEAAERDGRVVIAVTDTGIGIAPQAIDRVFEPFTQADSSMTRRFGGTGLGLSICRQIVTLMGGVIRVSSQPGLGATFTVEVPLTASGRETPPLQLVS